jgi:hypothetical protein
MKKITSNPPFPSRTIEKTEVQTTFFIRKHNFSSQICGRKLATGGPILTKSRKEKGQLSCQNKVCSRQQSFKKIINQSKNSDDKP